MSILLGIDGCPGGWIALSLDTENQNLRTHTERPLESSPPAIRPASTKPTPNWYFISSPAELPSPPSAKQRVNRPACTFCAQRTSPTSAPTCAASPEKPPPRTT